MRDSFHQERLNENKKRKKTGRKSDLWVGMRALARRERWVVCWAKSEKRKSNVEKVKRETAVCVEWFQERGWVNEINRNLKIGKKKKTAICRTNLQMIKSAGNRNQKCSEWKLGKCEENKNSCDLANWIALRKCLMSEIDGNKKTRKTVIQRQGEPFIGCGMRAFASQERKAVWWGRKINLMQFQEGWAAWCERNQFQSDFVVNFCNKRQNFIYETAHLAQKKKTEKA